MPSLEQKFHEARMQREAEAAASWQRESVTPEPQPAASLDITRRARRSGVVKGVAVAAGLATVFAGGMIVDSAINTRPATVAQTADQGIYSVSPSGTPEASAAAGSPSPDANPELGAVIGADIPVLQSVKDLKAYEPNKAPEGQWFNPIYDPFEADAAHQWRGIGPWYPVALDNIDPNAANFITHGTVGELIVQAKNGGKVEVAFWQIDAYQSDGAWGHDANGNIVHNPNWEMQYTFKNVPQGTVFHVVDADTGAQLTWPDGSPVTYLPSKYGDFSVEIPKTHGNDVRVGFVFDMPAAIAGQQPLEIKIERGPNDHPQLKGENPLPQAVIKPMVPGAGN